jgi:CDP-glucose 4,6-dehydratase
MSIPFNLFKGKRVLITGDTGFKGSWLALWLHHLGAEVTGFALPPEGDRPHFTLLGLNNIIRHIDGDIRNGEVLAAAFTEAQPEIVFHLAAQSLVRRSYDEPKRTLDTNVGGSVNVLESVRNCSSVRALVYITSDKCYRNKEWTFGYRENDELGGHDPYSASKAAAELVFSAYTDSFLNERGNFGGASTRAGNVIGGGDWAPDRIVPDCIRALDAENPIIIRNPHATRPWQHVLEPLSGYLALAAALYDNPEKFTGAWNFGPMTGSACSVESLANQISELWGSGKVIVDESGEVPHEANLLHLSIDKANLELGWRPRWNLNRTLAKTVGWYKRVIAEGKTALETSRTQIDSYMESDS